MKEEEENSSLEQTDNIKENGNKPEPLYEYICHPVKKNLTVSVLTTMVIIICLILTYFITYSVFMTLLGALILIGALSGFFFPTHYYFYEDHFIVKTTMQALRKEWSQYRSYYPDKNGVLLSPFTRPTRLENFRGIFIKFSGNRDKVINIVSSKIKFDKDDA